jgi:butyrate kinase
MNYFFFVKLTMNFELVNTLSLFKTNFSKTMKILVINPGSTSTKVAIFEDEKQIDLKVLRHSPEELSNFKTLWEQFDFRLKIILDFLKEKNLKPSDFSAVVGIGGLLRPVKGGTYRVNDKMLEDARANFQGEHPSNLGCALAYEIAKLGGVDAFIVDPVSVDEFEPLARYSGHPLIQRRSLSHALNIHAVARLASEKIGKKLDETNFVIAHLGGGISVCPVKGGKIIDANDASSDGPFSPERTGGLPLQPFISLCFSGKYTEQEIRKMVMGKGGLVAYLGTNNADEVEKRIQNGDEYAREVYEAMAYQIAKEIGAMATVLKGKVDAIVLTGGLANSKMLVDWITERVSFIAPVLVFPGEDEMRALALGVLRVLRGEEQAKEYPE